ncbi:MAG: Ada metal-binding domain-containing protein [Firmicutes bacterium]|nr:Ada metal-binding domain-containing protein [Bacillota bacterium]
MKFGNAKRIILVLFSAFIVLLFNSCAYSYGKAQVFEPDYDLVEKFEYYETSAALIAEKMELDSKEADELFLFLTQHGLKSRILYIIKSYDPVSDEHYYKIWSEESGFSVYPGNNGVRKLMVGDTVVYSDVSEDFSRSMPDLSEQSDEETGEESAPPDESGCETERVTVPPDPETSETETELSPESETDIHEPVTVSTESETIVPEPETLPPKSETTSPEPETLPPESETVLPEPETTKPETVTVPPEPETAVSETADDTSNVNETSYIANASTGVYHRSSCGHAKRIKDENRKIIGSKEEAEEAGYRPCKTCKP